MVFLYKKVQSFKKKAKDPPLKNNFFVLKTRIAIFWDKMVIFVINEKK
jgi:hypothetical protein